MHSQIAVIGAAVETQIDSKRHTAPCWVLRSTVEADLVGLLALQLLEDFERFRLGRERHCERGGDFAQLTFESREM